MIFLFKIYVIIAVFKNQEWCW